MNLKRKSILILRALSLLCLLAICLIAFVFSNESSQKSNDQSSSAAQSLAQAAIENYHDLSERHKALLTDQLNTSLRKGAHAAEFALMGICAALFALTFLPAEPKEGMQASGKKRKALQSQALIWLAALFCLLYAVSDEVHQFFVPGRACLLSDIVLDSLSALSGILFIWGLFVALERRKNEKRTA